MKRLIYLILVTVISISTVFAQKKGAKSLQPEITTNYLDASFKTYDRLQKEIWSYAELGFLESKSSKALQEHLKSNGFQVSLPACPESTYFHTHRLQTCG